MILDLRIERRFFQITFFLTAIFILVVACIPNPPGTLTPSDKTDHILAFFVLSWLARRADPDHVNGYWIGGLLAYGLVIEILQYFIPGRSFSLWDLAADALGILVAYLTEPLFREVIRVEPVVTPRESPSP